MKKILSLLSVAGIVAFAGIAQAQDAVPPAGAGVEVTTETTTTVPGETVVGAYEDPGTMPATGGAPIAMALVGSLTAAGAFFARRKLS